MGPRLYMCLAATLIAFLAAILSPAGLLAPNWDGAPAELEGDDFSLLQSSALAGHAQLKDTFSSASKSGNDIKAAGKDTIITTSPSFPVKYPLQSMLQNSTAQIDSERMATPIDLVLLSQRSLAVASYLASHTEGMSTAASWLLVVFALMLGVVVMTCCGGRPVQDARSSNILAHQDFTKSPQSLQGASRHPPAAVDTAKSPPQQSIPERSTPQQPGVVPKRVPQQPQVRSPGLPQVQSPILALGHQLMATQTPAAGSSSMPQHVAGQSRTPPMTLIPHPSEGSAGLQQQQVEFRFAVSLSELRRCEAQPGREVVIDIKCLSGAPPLQMVIVGGTRLDIRSQQHDVSIQTPTSLTGDGCFTIHDRSGRQYGKFKTKSAQLGLTEIVIGGTDVMMVQGYSNNLSFSVTITGGKPIALARINSEEFDDDHFEVRVLPRSGSDPVLVLAVLLALAVTME